MPKYELECTINRCGTFSQPGSVHVGDPYTGGYKMPELPRHKGKQMYGPGAKWGTNPDAMIDKDFKRLSENTVYVDQWVLEKRIKKAEMTKPVMSSRAFLPCGKTAITKAKGSDVGCFNKIERVPGDIPDPNKPRGPGPRNLYCNPPPVGGYGRAGFTIGKMPEFIADPYLNSREFEKLDKKKARERLPKPWGATGVSKGCFTPNPFAESPGPTYIRPSKARPPGFKPFRGGGPAATGANMTFTPCKYVPDPETEKWEAAKKARLAALPRGPGFKVLGGIRTWYTRGINHFATEARHKPDVEIIN